MAVTAWLAIYLPDAGRGFIKDDFAWLLVSPLSASPWQSAWDAPTGFFRPLVSLSFTINYALFGLHPLGYGLTNVALAAACAAMIFLVARAVGLTGRAAAFAAALWLFTPHGMDMGVIWISGRSALLLVLCATAACWAAARGYMPMAAGLLLLALLSKEEGVMVPVLAALAMAVSSRATPAHARSAWMVVPAILLVAYFSLRSGTDALTPESAPDTYRYRMDASLLLSNAAQYLDRLATFPVVVLTVIWLTARGTAGTGVRHGVVLAGLTWAAVAMLPTIALPVRSSLYVLLPLVGVCLAAGAISEPRLNAADPRLQRRLAMAFVVIALAAIPVYRARHRDWSDAARLSATVTAAAARDLRDVPDGWPVRVRDRREEPNLDSAFGTLLPEMLKVTTGKRFQLVAEEPAASLLLAPVPR